MTGFGPEPWAAAIVLVTLVITAAVAVTVVRTDSGRFDHRTVALMGAIAGMQATLALVGPRGHVEGTASIVLARLDVFLWALGGLASTAFVVAFPLGRPPGPKVAWLYGLLTLLALVLAIVLPVEALGAMVGTVAIAVGVVATNGGILQVRRLSHPRGATARLVAAASIVATWAFVGAATVLTDAVTASAPFTPPSMAVRGAPLLAGALAGLAACHYALIDARRLATTIGTWLVGGALLLALTSGYGFVMVVRGATTPSAWAPDFGLAALCITMVAMVLGVTQRARSDTALASSDLISRSTLPEAEITAGPRETLIALDRLTDPLAVQERVVEALTELLPGAKLELLRARLAPPGVLAGAREVSTPLALAAVRRGYLASHQIDELTQPSRAAFAELGGALVVPVRCGPAVFGVLLLDNLRVDRHVIVQARRFADLLGYKLETHRLYAELETHRRLASLGTLATALAHDLRTPLSAIRMNIQMLEMRRDVLGADVECLDIALAEVDRLNAQISTLLDFARPVDLDVDELDIGALLAEALTRVAPAAAEAGVTTTIDVAPDLPRLPGDPSRLSRVFVNLIDNAFQASAAGSEVQVHAFATSEVVDVVIRDHGRGIAAEDLPRIFDPFFTTRADGTGLGLAICRKIAQAHGGQILVSSEPGVGSEFRVRLPRRRATPTAT